MCPGRSEVVKLKRSLADMRKAERKRAQAEAEAKERKAGGAGENMYELLVIQAH